MSKKALGKGIEALIFAHEDKVSQSAGVSVQTLSMSSIRPNPNQPRVNFNEDSLKELSDSIREKGIIQPIIVEESGTGMYVIIAGERRFRAATAAGLSEIPVIVRQFSDEEKLEIALIENVQREDLTPIEEARAYRNLMDFYHLNQEEVAKKVGKNRSTVANSVRLLKLPTDMQEAMTKGDFTAGHARAILSLVNPADQRILFNRIMANGLSVREAETLAGEMNRGVRSVERTEKVKKRQNPDIVQVEQRFIDILGTKVSVKGTMQKGRIEISYFSMDDLERVLEILNK